MSMRLEFMNGYNKQQIMNGALGALTDANGGYPIERRSDKMTEHIVLIGNPLPIPERFRSLKFAEDEQLKLFRLDLDSHNSWLTPMHVQKLQLPLLCS